MSLGGIQPDSAGRPASPLTADEMWCLLKQGASPKRAFFCLWLLQTLEGCHPDCLFCPADLNLDLCWRKVATITRHHKFTNRNYGGKKKRLQ